MQPSNLEMERIDRGMPAPVAQPPQPILSGYKEAYFNQLGAALGTVLDTSARLIYDREVKTLLVKPAPGQLPVVDPEADKKKIAALLHTGLEAMPDLAKKAAEVFMQIGIGVNLQFENAVDSQDFNAPASPELETLFKWLLQDEGKAVAVNTAELTIELNKKLSKDLQRYLEGLFTWMSSDRVELIRNHLKLENYNEDSAKETLLEIVKGLVALKVNRQAAQIVAKLQNQLPAIAEKFLRQDVMKAIGKAELAKVFELIKKMNWNQLIDGSVEDIRNHMRSTKASMDAYETYMNSKKAERSEAIEKLDRLTLNEIHDIAYGHLLRGFATPTSHSIIQKISKNAAHYESTLPQEERAFYTKTSKDILKIFVPKNYEELLELYDKLNLPEELKSMREEVKQLAAQLLDKKTHDFISKAPRKVGEFVKLFEESILGAVRKAAAQQMVELIQTKVNKYTNPDKLNEFILKRLMPIALQEMYREVAKNAFEVHFKNSKEQPGLVAQTAELRRNANAKPEDEEERLKGIRDSIKAKLDKWSKETAPSLKNEGHDPKTVEAGIEAFIAKLEETVQEAKTEAEVQAAIVALYTPAPADLYGDAQKYMAKKIDFFAAQFELWLQGNEIARRAIYEDLGKEFKGRDQKAFEPLVEGIRKNLMEIQKTLNKPYEQKLKDKAVGPEDRPIAISKAYIQDFLNRHFQGEASKMDVYVDLINQTVLLSDKNGYAWVIDWFKDKAKTGLLTATKDLRLSPAYALEMAAKSLPKALTYEALDDLLYGPDGLNASKEAEALHKLKGWVVAFKRNLENTTDNLQKAKSEKARADITQAQAKLKEEIRNTENLIAKHPLTEQNAKLKAEFDKIGALTQDLVPQLRGMTTIVTGGAEGISRTMQDLVGKILGTQIRTKGLVFVLLDRIARSLIEANAQRS